MTSDEELAEQAACVWAKAVQASDAPAVWRSSSADLRLVLAQLWLAADSRLLGEAGASGDRDALARLLADPGAPDGRLRRACMRASTLRMRSAFGGYADADLVVAARARLVEPGLMLVRLFGQDAPYGGHVAPSEHAEALLVLCTMGEGGWCAAGIGDRLLLPGWPPVRRRVDLGAAQRCLPA